METYAIFDDIFILLHFNQSLRDFMIIIRNSKLILYFFNLVHITSNKNYYSISNIINNIKYFVKYFTQNPGISNIFFDDLQNLSGNLKKLAGFEGNLRNF
jgi:hypothetical protein